MQLSEINLEYRVELLEVKKLFFLIFIFNWRLTALQYCVSAIHQQRNYFWWKHLLDFSLDTHRDRVERRRQILKAASKSWAKEHLNQQAHHHLQEDSHCGSCQWLTCFCHPHHESHSLSLLSSVNGGCLVCGLSKQREVGLDEWVSQMWLMIRIIWELSNELQRVGLCPDLITQVLQGWSYMCIF